MALESVDDRSERRRAEMYSTTSTRRLEWQRKHFGVRRRRGGREEGEEASNILASGAVFGCASRFAQLLLILTRIV